MDTNILLNNFAVRSFRDIADCDYIAARLAYRAQLVPQFLWSSLQSIEKYLKCVLVLNRIRAPKSHDLGEILNILEKAKRFDLRLTPATREFFIYLDTYGRHRYFETPYFTKGLEIVRLDRAVWEIRRYAQVLDYQVTSHEGRKINMLHPMLDVIETAERCSPHKFFIIGGHLEAIIAKQSNPAREPLLWQNAFFGRKPRKTVRLASYMHAANSPLSLHPEILDEVLKYVFLPKDVINAYRCIS